MKTMLLFALVIPAVALAGWLQRGDELIYRDPVPASLVSKGWREVSVITNSVVSTNYASADVCKEAHQIALIMTNFPDMVADTGYDFSAMLRWCKTHAATLANDHRDSMADTMKLLWADVEPFAPNGLPNFTGYVVVTNRQIVVNPKE